MNFTQMHERLRVVLLDRIRRGALSVSLLSRQTGLAQSHISNFLRKKRNLSLDAMDRILRAQEMAADNLLRDPRSNESESLITTAEGIDMVPIVSYGSAISEPIIHPSAILSMLPAPSGVLESARFRAPSTRRTWQRFVAARIPPADAFPMEPLVLPESIVVIDRHYNSSMPYQSSRPTLYAVRDGARLLLRYVDFFANAIVLRTLNPVLSTNFLEIEMGSSPNDLIVGRVALLLNPT
ncbi:MAG: helix-turn-helix domain-containing protein [Terracidiphilus sp.]